MRFLDELEQWSGNERPRDLHDNNRLLPVSPERERPCAFIVAERVPGIVEHHDVSIIVVLGNTQRFQRLGWRTRESIETGNAKHGRLLVSDRLWSTSDFHNRMKNLVGRNVAHVLDAVSEHAKTLRVTAGERYFPREQQCTAGSRIHSNARIQLPVVSPALQLIFAIRQGRSASTEPVDICLNEPVYCDVACNYDRVLPRHGPRSSRSGRPAIIEIPPLGRKGLSELTSTPPG